MNIFKKGIVMLLAVCVLSGVPAVNAWAANDCDHLTVKYINTGQYKTYSYTHTVTVGWYTDGTSIDVTCKVNRKVEFQLIHCAICNEYITYREVVREESHTVVHN